ncbi:hypothetical protein CLM85_03090 [Streptomyces albidoflavus]|nr:hypothetical protein CLM85_03090 [Streptomyces albidoflavus]
MAGAVKCPEPWVPVPKGRSNRRGCGGRRNKLPRNGRPASAPGGAADNRPAAPPGALAGRPLRGSLLR